MRADAGNLDDRRLRREAGCARGIADRVRNRGGGRFADRAAFLANQEHHRITARMIVHAGDKGIAAFDAMHESLRTQEVERTINGDRRRARARFSQAVDQLISADRLVTGQQRLQDAAAGGRELFGACGADRLGISEASVGATVMVMTGRRKNRG